MTRRGPTASGIPSGGFSWRTWDAASAHPGAFRGLWRTPPSTGSPRLVGRRRGGDRWPPPRRASTSGPLRWARREPRGFRMIRPENGATRRNAFRAPVRGWLHAALGVGGRAEYRTRGPRRRCDRAAASAMGIGRAPLRALPLLPPRRFRLGGAGRGALSNGTGRRRCLSSVPARGRPTGRGQDDPTRRSTGGAGMPPCREGATAMAKATARGPGEPTGRCGTGSGRRGRSGHRAVVAAHRSRQVRAGPASATSRRRRGSRRSAARIPCARRRPPGGRPP